MAEIVDLFNREIAHGFLAESEWTTAAGATHYAVWIYNIIIDELVILKVVDESNSYIYDDLRDDGDIYAGSVVASDVYDGIWSDFSLHRLL